MPVPSQRDRMIRPGDRQVRTRNEHKVAHNPQESAPDDDADSTVAVPRRKTEDDE